MRLNPDCVGKELVAWLSPRVGLLGAGLHLPLEQDMEQREMWGLVTVLLPARNRRPTSKGLKRERRCASCAQKPQGRTAQDCSVLQVYQQRPKLLPPFMLFTSVSQFSGQLPS